MRAEKPESRNISRALLIAALHPDSRAFVRLAEETGGRVFRVSRKHPLEDAFSEIQQEMRSQYAIDKKQRVPIAHKFVDVAQ